MHRSVSSVSLFGLSISYRALIGAISLAAGLSLATHASATTVFSDTFNNGSVLNPTSPGSYPAVTANSTGYEIASTKNSTGSANNGISSGDLKYGYASTTSGFCEIQALFTNSPVALASTGDSIELTMTFTATSGILSTGSTSSAAIYWGMYNSGSPQSAPVSGLNNSGLNGTANSPFATGGTQLWQGYVESQALGSEKINTRPQQNITNAASATSATQELLGSGASTGTYTNPAGANITPNGSTSLGASLANGAGVQYTEDMLISLTGPGTLSITTGLYSGVGTGGTQLSTQTVSATGAIF